MFLSTLPPEQAEIVQRAVIDGERPEDVAHSLGLSASMMAYQLGCGRQALKELFAEMSRICPEHGLAGCDCNLANRPDP
jgi:DNA-directed RNA polymerase specialized sigma24 family protein